MFDRISQKFRETNESLASASKAWRDQSLSKREELVAAREMEARAAQEQIAKWQSSRKWRRAGTVAIFGVSVLFAYVLGYSVRGSVSHDAVADRQSVSGMKQSSPSPVRNEAKVDQSWKRVSKSVVIPTDPTGSNEIIAWRLLSNGHRESISYRVGTSGESYGRREINCSDNTFRYLGTGDTLEEAMLERPDPKLTPLLTGSISTAISDETCLL